MAVQAVRYTLPENDETFDLMLRNVLIDMLLVILQDPDMEIRRLAMTTLNSAAHNKPDLILPHLGELMPFVLQESVVKTELVREVMLGPFKHLVDDGLEVRKVSRRMIPIENEANPPNRARMRPYMHSWKLHLLESAISTFTIALWRVLRMTTTSGSCAI